MKRQDEVIFKLPLIILVLLVLVAWKVVLAVGVIALFFGFRYSFEGKDDLKQANDFMEGAGNVAESFKEGFQAKDKQEE